MDFSKEEPNLPSDSDDSDEDYVPSGAESNPPSEIESEGDDEDPPESDEEDPSTKKRRRSQKASKKKARKKNRKSTPKENVNIEEKGDDDDDDDPENSDKKALTEEEEKKHADSLWADFMSDTKAYKPQPKKITMVKSKLEETEDKISKEKEPKKEEKENKVTVTEVFEFAGEEVKVTKEVDATSKEARIGLASPKPVGSSSSGLPAGRGRGRSPGGLSSILGQIGKKSKIGTLEKSKLDWDHFKKTEGIEDELRTFNRGKDGYLEKQDFLQRTDLRQFEIEKGLRATRRSNR